MSTPVFISAWSKHWEGVFKALPTALVNTVLGIGIVFLALVFISFIISCFKYFSVIEKKKAEKAAAKKEEAELPEKAIENTVAQITEAEELSDDSELVAVITAAIYAYESAAGNNVQNGLVVRSIRKAKKCGWQNA